MQSQSFQISACFRSRARQSSGFPWKNQPKSGDFGYRFGTTESANCHPRRQLAQRRGGVYIAVLGTALITALVGISALVVQRIQNRVITSAADIRRAQLNAETAVELGLLTMKQNDNWRDLRDGQSYLIKDRELVLGGGSTCSLEAPDAASDASDPLDRPVQLVGIGRHGPGSGAAPRTSAEQRVEVVIDPRRKPHDCLKSGSSATPTWQTIFDHYGGPPMSPNGAGTKLEINSLPDRAPPQGSSFAQNVSVTYNDTYWDRADQISSGAPEFASSNVNRVEDTLGHEACLEIDRSNRKGGVANRLKSWLLKPSTQYRVDIQIYAGLLGNVYKAFLVTDTNGTIQVTSGSTVSILAAVGQSWQDRTFTVTTPAWTTHPDKVYVAINSDTAGGSAWDFYVDNIDVYETGARFIYQTVLGSGVNQLYSGAPTNSWGTYWIDCQNTTKLVIERSRIFGTLLVENPGPGSCIAYGPVHMSPAVPGYPILLVCNSGGNAFAIRATPDPSSNPADDDLTEGENGTNFNPTGAPHKTLGTDNDQSDAYDSEIRGLVVVGGNLDYANNPVIRGRVLVGGSVTGTPALTYLPDSLLNPPPPLGGFYTYRYDLRPASIRKSVLP
jgi:hypothetical protein